ncbi:MAG TPA: RNA polymerase sigma-70 factor, partial [Cyanobacteria bacterium UBA11049]|nr:RNA polymerase sigma-70 factor [Cyanobacteria bacterium UBA11049]
LHPRKRQIFLMHRQEGLSYQEIADQLQLSKKTVEFHMNDCLNWFRHNFKLHTDIILVGVLALYIV